MRTLHLLSLLSIGLALPTTAQAQFSAMGGGSAIPFTGEGGGGNWDTGLPISPAISVVDVQVEVLEIDSVVIDGFQHTWAGDVQAVLFDPTGVGYNLILRPGYQNPDGANFGTPGNFVDGTYTIVENGGASLPTLSDGADIQPGTYNQSSSTGAVSWTSGNHNINNTPLGSITGPSGFWELRVYDWGVGDNGSFTGWTLNGNGGASGENTGSAYCFGDGNGTACPCGGNGSPGEGCLTTSGTGALLTGTGNAEIGDETFVLTVTGGPPNKPGIFFQGTSATNGGLGNTVGDGILCAGPTLRFGVNILDGAGSTNQASFGASTSVGMDMKYQYWFRDTANTCGGGFNFSNAWEVTWE